MQNGRLTPGIKSIIMQRRFNGNVDLRLFHHIIILFEGLEKPDDIDGFYSIQKFRNYIFEIVIQQTKYDKIDILRKMDSKFEVTEKY